MSQAPNEHLQDTLSAAVEALNRDGDLTFKSMFGGVCGYVQGRVFASLSDVGLALKLAPADQAALLQLPEAKRLQYEPNAPESKQYIVVPAEMYEAETLSHWVAKSIELVLSLPAPKPKPRK